MEKYDLSDVAIAQLQIAKDAPAGRSSATVLGGHASSLRQTVIALVEGQVMEIENGPHEATLLVLSGSFDITTVDEGAEASSGDLVILPTVPHTITARDDTTALLTVAKGDYPD